ncbi:hypothetical protein [uncultured Cetobacterium sp.]|uniref:hypothetical protein n=1 Tax=uncultured Cetobacterium sp. TaxID=527638 RepID=UPI002618DA2A|nr:hypothetical protein [uncultured Cetobacterium sp.]
MKKVKRLISDNSLDLAKDIENFIKDIDLISVNCYEEKNKFQVAIVIYDTDEDLN